MGTEADSVSMRVPFKAPSAALVRSTLKDWLLERGLTGEALDDARVVISELVGNSVRHAHPLPKNELLVMWCLDDSGALIISVRDGGGVTVPHTVSPSRSAISGRGLAIVQALADRWWTEETNGGTTVHVRLPL